MDTSHSTSTGKSAATNKAYFSFWEGRGLLMSILGSLRIDDFFRDDDF